MDFFIKEEDFYYLKSIDPDYIPPALLILFYSKNNIPWTVNSLSKQTKTIRKKIDRLLVEMKRRGIFPTLFKNEAKNDQEISSLDQHLVQLFLKNQNLVEPIPERIYEISSTGYPQALVQHLVQRKSNEKKEQKLTKNDRIEVDNKNKSNSFESNIKVKRDKKDMKQSNENELNKVILKPLESTSLFKCRTTSMCFALVLTSSRIYIITTCNLSGSKHDGETDRCIILSPEKPVKNFRHISFVVLNFYKFIFKIVCNKDIDNTNFHVIKKFLEDGYEYDYLIKSIVGYRLNSYFMQFNDKPLISFIFKTPERIYQLYNYYGNNADKIITIDNLNIIQYNSVEQCPQYNEQHCLNKISFCTKDKELISISNGVKICWWHNYENLALTDPISYWPEVNRIKRYIESDNKKIEYIKYLQDEYGEESAYAKKLIKILMA